MLAIFALRSLLAIIRPPLQNKCWDMSRFIRISPGDPLLPHETHDSLQATMFRSSEFDEHREGRGDTNSNIDSLCCLDSA